MFRGQVTAVDAKGVYVLVPSLHPTQAFGPLDHVGARPAVGARVLVADCGDESTPDLVVMTGSGPATSTDNAVARFDGTGGALQNSGVTIDDNGKVSASRLALASTDTHTVQMENSTSFEAKNAAGTYEEFLWPRWADNTMYMNYGAGGWNIRNSGSNTRFYATDAGQFVVWVPSEGVALGWGGPTITSGTGAPSYSPPNGSVYLRTDGTASTTLYVRAGGAWSALS